MQPKKILDYVIWVPPLSWQNLIAGVQAKVDALKHLQIETTAELEVLLSSILDKAFEGKL